MDYRRHLLGVAGIIMLVVAGLFWSSGETNSNLQAMLSVCMRAGLVLCALWLALPQLVRLLAYIPRWMLAGIAIALILLITYPRALLYLWPLAIAMIVVQFIGWLFKPLPKKNSDTKRK